MTDIFCKFPWHSIYISPSGRVENCCISKNNLGHVSDFDAALIRNNRLKRAFVAGEKPEGCSWCFNNPGTPYADSILHSLANDKNFVYNTNTEDFKLRFLDIRWKNTCTLSCVYCSPEFSSSWAKLNGEDANINTQDTNKKLKEWLEPQLKDLKRVYLAGGEPLLIKDNEWLLTKLMEVNNANLNILVNTNAQNFDTRVFELLKEFNNVTWLVSGENIGEKFEQVRRGASWDTFVGNVRWLKENNQTVLFQTIFHTMNTNDIFNFLDWVVDEGFELDKNVSLSYIMGPEFDPAQLDSTERARITQNVNNYSNLHPEIKPQFDAILTQLNTTQI